MVMKTTMMPIAMFISIFNAMPIAMFIRMFMFIAMFIPMPIAMFIAMLAHFHAYGANPSSENPC